MILTLLYALGSTAVQSTTSVQVRDSAGVDVVQVPSPAETSFWRVDPDPTLTIGVSLGDPAYEFGAISGAVTLQNGSIVIADRMAHSLRYFDSEGGLEHTTGRSGEGPGEFSDLSVVLRLAGDTVLVVDWPLSRASLFDAAGQFVRSTRLAPTPDMRYPSIKGQLATGEFVAVPEIFSVSGRGPARAIRDSIPITLFGPDGASLGVLGWVPGYDRVVKERGAGRYVREYVAFGRGPLVAVWDSLVGVGGTEAWQFRWYNRSGVLQRTMGRSSPVRSVTAADYEAFVMERVGEVPEAQRGRYAESLRDDPTIAERFPVVGPTTLVDQTDALWVPDYRAPRDSVQVWTVVEATGRVGRVTLAREYRLWDAGATFVLVERRTESGTPQIVLLRLHR